jgi:predicted MFS family arabinose efflux permease
VGLLALVGVVTMAATPLAGRTIDRRGPDHVNAMALVGSIVAAPVLAVGGAGGAAGLAALVGGTLLLDVAMQCGMVANVARFYAVRPEARNRMNSGYMTCAYLGGSAGSLAGTMVYASLGWPAVAALVALAPAPALAVPAPGGARRPQPFGR